MSSARAIRRAAERLALKAARPSAVSEAQLAANRENALLSTGPRTEAGKAVSSHNAVKTGLTGRTILLPSDDVAAYQKLVAMMHAKFNPANDYEEHLVQTIADTEWRLLRIPTLEAGLYALGRRQFADECPEPAALEAFIFHAYEKDLRNLALQERRLRNQLKQHIAELRALQQQRLAEREEALKLAAALFEAAETAGQPWIPAENGFEFSIEEIKRFLAAQPGAQKENPSLAAAA